MEKHSAIQFFLVFYGFIFIAISSGCATARNNGIGTDGAGNVHIEAAASIGAITDGIEGVSRSNKALTESIDRSIEGITDGTNAQQVAIERNNDAQSGISEAIELNTQVSAIIQQIRDRERQRTGDTHGTGAP